MERKEGRVFRLNADISADTAALMVLFGIPIPSLDRERPPVRGRRHRRPHHNDYKSIFKAPSHLGMGRPAQSEKGQP